MLKLMMNFLKTKNCRRRLLLGHFEEESKNNGPDCCDNCSQVRVGENYTMIKGICLSFFLKNTNINYCLNLGDKRSLDDTEAKIGGNKKVRK